MDLVSCTVFDFRVPSYVEKSVMHPFSYGKRNLPSSSKEGDTIYLDKKVTMKFTHEGEKSVISIAVWPKIRGRKGTGAPLRHLPRGDETPIRLVIATPFQKSPAHFLLQTEDQLPSVRAGYAKTRRGIFIDLKQGTLMGVLDWGARASGTYQKHLVLEQP
jgi:hypothetical protein